MDTMISLFDVSGVMAQPWRDAGYRTVLADIQHKGEGWILTGTGDREAWTFGGDLRDGFTLPQFTGRVAFVAAFPPCTDVAVSGAKHFLKKGPRALALALDLFATARETGEACGCPYMIENPVSTFSTYCGKPDHIFHPYEYGGYLPEDDQHPQWPEYIAPRDAYPKKTCLWTGGGFQMPERRPVEIPEGYSTQFKNLGGKSLKTKNIRSQTPRGFAQAVFEIHQKKKLTEPVN